MDKFDQYVLQNIQKEDINFEPSDEIKEELIRVDQFLEESDTAKEEDQKTILMNQVNTLIGFLSQLMLRSNHPYLKDLIEDISKHQQTYIDQLNQARKIEDEQTIISTLETLNATVSDYYNQTKNEMITSVKQSISLIEEREVLLKEVEELVGKVNAYIETAKTDDEKQIVQTLAGLYVKAMEEDIHTLNGLEQEVALLKQWKTNATPILELEKKQTPQIPEETKEDAENIKLLDKMNDKIVNYQTIEENGKIYVKYTLENGKYYFAVVESKEQVDEIYKNFEENAQLSNEQTKEAWKQNLETIVFCLQVYYIFNEYVRYQKVSNQDKMTKEKTEEINQYTNTLNFIENSVLRPYLDYAKRLSELVLVGENDASTFYSNEATSQEVTKGNVEQLVVSVLGNSKIENDVMTKDILQTLYPIKEEDYLLRMEKVGTPMGHEMQEIAMTEAKENTHPSIPVTNEEKTVEENTLETQTTKAIEVPQEVVETHDQVAIPVVQTASPTAEVPVPTQTIPEPVPVNPPQQEESKQEENETPPPAIPEPGPIQETNYDKMEKYLDTRRQAYLSPLPEVESANVSKREEDNLYEGLNLYLDLEEATQITNTVYQAQNPGQGTNAKMAYLKEGNPGGFTSKYHARELASKVDRNEYFYQMLNQAVKDYATFNEQRKKNPSFGVGIENLFSMVGQEVLEEQFDGNRLVKNILSDDTMLQALSKNFDGRYLVPEKQDEPLFQTVLQDYEKGNPMFAEKVKNALASLRDQFMHEAYQVPTKSSLEQIQIPSGKVAA